MSFTILQDKNIREEQYRKSINFYLKKTKQKIVFCENSGTDISSDYKQYIEEGRIEFLTFDGNNYDKSLGKGYGEAKIILYAINNSKFINGVDDCYIVKITGRLQIDNIHDVISNKFLFLKNIIMCDFADNTRIYSMIFISPLKWIREINNYLEEFNDSKGIFMEHVLYKMLIQTHFIIVPFIKSPVINGVNGSFGLKYEQILPSNIYTDNFYFLSKLYRKKGDIIKSYFLYAFYVCYTKYHTLIINDK